MPSGQSSLELHSKTVNFILMHHQSMEGQNLFLQQLKQEKKKK